MVGPVVQEKTYPHKILLLILRTEKRHIKNRRRRTSFNLQWRDNVVPFFLQERKPLFMTTLAREYNQIEGGRIVCFFFGPLVFRIGRKYPLGFFDTLKETQGGLS